MIIKISDSNISVFFLDCFRFQVCGNEYNVLLNKRDIDLYHYEIWKKDGDNLVFVDDVFLSLDKFREYYFADERSTNFKIMNIPKWRSLLIRQNRATYSNLENHLIQITEPGNPI